MSGTHNNLPLTNSIDKNSLDNYSIEGDAYGYKGLLDGLLASDKAYSQLMGYFGEAGSGTELIFNITDLGNTPTAFNATLNTIFLDKKLFDADLEVTKMTGDLNGDGILDGDLNSDGIVNALDQNIYIQNLTTEAMLGASGLTGTALETLKNDLATDDTPSSSHSPMKNKPLPKIEETSVEEEAPPEEPKENTSMSHSSSHQDTKSKSTTMHSEDPTGISNALHEAFNVVGGAIDMDIEKEMQDLFKKHKSSIEAAHKTGDRDKREKANNALTKDFQILSVQMIQKLSDAIQNATGADKEKLLDAAATWIKYGLHSPAENGENGNEAHGIHSLDHSKDPKVIRAFQIAHMMNAGNDTKIGDTFRKGVDTTDALHNLDGAALLKLMENGTLADLFTSDTKYVDGKKVADPDGTKLSAGWGASGDARLEDAQPEFGMGARQNLWPANAAFNQINT